MLDILTKEIQDFTEHVDELPLIPTVSSHEIRDHLKSKYSFDNPLPLEEINLDVQKMMRQLIERQSQLGDYLRIKLRAAGFEIVNDTPLPVVCFTHPKIDDKIFSATDALNLLYSQKNFWISQTKLKNSIPVLRACIISFRTTEKDLDGLVSSLIEIVAKKVITGSAVS